MGALAHVALTERQQPKDQFDPKLDHFDVAQHLARLGGGTVEGYPEVTEGRKVSASFLYNGTAAMFESQGFTRDRQIGKHRWVMRRTV